MICMRGMIHYPVSVKPDNLIFIRWYYNRKVLTETGSRTTGLSFNVRSLYQSLLFCYLDLEVALTTQALYGVYSCVSGRQGSHMYVGSYMTSP